MMTTPGTSLDMPVTERSEPLLRSMPSAACSAPWRVVTEAIPRGGDHDDLAVVHVFNDYEAAWQFAHATHVDARMASLAGRSDSASSSACWTAGWVLLA